jgi:pimeloyl-ACP methyl ester carboxylesterase/uncharacterized protein YjiS (DUF1127 family)
MRPAPIRADGLAVSPAVAQQKIRRGGAVPIDAAAADHRTEWRMPMSTIARSAEPAMLRSLLRTVGTALGRLGRAFVGYWEHREAEAHLLSLDDRLLKDIGLTRSDIVSAVHSASRPKRREAAANDRAGASGLFYREAGFGRPVVLLHSTAGTGGQWKSLCAALKPHYRVIAPDLPGYGRSPAADAGGLGADAAPLIALIEGLGAPVHLVGHSYGGALALKIAATRPELVGSLCLIEPVAFQLLRNPRAGDRRLLEEIGAVETAIRAGIESGAPETGMARFIDFWNGDGSWARLEPELQSHLRDKAEQVAANFAAIASEPVSQAPLRAIVCPTLVIRGERSPAPARRVAELLAAAIPGAAFVEIPRAGHMAPLTHAEAVDPIVTRHVWESEFDTAIPLARQDRGLKPAA